MNTHSLLIKTRIILITTIITMLAEIYFGFTTHSMGLLADGFHMGTHAFAFLITLIVCHFVIKYHYKEKQLNALGGCISAILLCITALGIIIESIERFIHPLSISFSQAILVAVIGLVINAVCILIMEKRETHCQCHCYCDHHPHEHENLNYKAAYFHILADAMTSVFAILALICAKYFNLIFLDPLIGIISALIILKWGADLIKKSLKILI